MTCSVSQGGTAGKESDNMRSTYEAPKIRAPRFRVHWSRIIGSLAIGLGIIVLMVAAWTLGARFTPAPTPVSVPASSAVEDSPIAEPEPLDLSQGGTLEPCEYEDSMNCYWDAGESGNGEGRSFIAKDGFLIYADGETVPVDEPEATEPEPEAVTPEPQAEPGKSALADQSPVWESPDGIAAWPYSTGETIVCGHDAKPAIDYREDGIGWWAYCEPALAD